MPPSPCQKALLFHPPMELGYSVLTPLGLAAIHAATPEGVEADVRDMTRRRWADLSLDSLEPYDVIGVSVRYTYNASKTRVFLRAVADRFPDKVLVAGGPHATHDLGGMRSSGVGYVVRFSGEGVWRELVSALRDGRDPSGIAGLACLRERQAQVEVRRTFEDPGGLPIPSFHLFRPADYPFAAGLSGASLEASRGCPNHCRFCTNPAAWLGRWGAKSVPRILEELDVVQGLGFSFVFFADDNFGVDPEHLRELVEAMARRKRPIFFMATMQPRTIALHPEILDPAWRGGLRILSLDTNTVDEGIREQYGKADGFETVRRALDAVRRSRIAAVSNVIVGAPGETREAMKRNIRFTKSHADVFSCGTLEPRPGNGYWRESDWERTDHLGRGEALLHDEPRMVRRLVLGALLGYYLRPRNVLRALFSPKVGTRILFRLHYRLYASAALHQFIGRDRTGPPSSGTPAAESADGRARPESGEGPR